MFQLKLQNKPQTVQTKKYKLVEIKELCKVHGIPYENDIDINPNEFVFVDEHGEEWDMISYFEGTTILGMYEDKDKLYVIAGIRTPINIHEINLFVFKRVK